MKLAELLGDIDLKLYAFDRIHCGAWWNFPAVNSPFARLFHVLEGEALLRHGGREWPLVPGRLVLSPPFTPVDYLCRGGFENYYAIFTCRVAGGLDLFSLGEMDWSSEADALTPGLFAKLHELNPGRGLKFTDPYRPDYNSSIWASGPNGMSAEAALGTDGILRLLLSRFVGSFRLKAGGEGQEAAVRFLPSLQYMERHLDEPLTLGDLAKTAHLHPTYFSDSFFRAVGTRPIAFLNRKRLERAQLLLLTTGMELKEIAAVCGFKDATYFHKVFKARTGLTPVEYRSDA